MSHTIRRNAKKKIAALAAQAIRAERYDSGDGARDRTLETAEEMAEALADWFDWNEGRAIVTSAERFRSDTDGGPLRMRRQKILRLTYHRNLCLDFVLEEELAQEA